MTGDSTLQVTDERTGRRYVIPIRDGAIHAIDLRQIKMTDGDVGLLSYDPAFLNTASCRAAITFIDGEQGILRYRGYPIEELAEHRSFLDVAYLLINGELPDKADGRAVDRADHSPHLHPREHQEVHRRLPPRRPSDGHPGRHRRGAVHLLPGRQGRLRRVSAASSS